MLVILRMSRSFMQFMRENYKYNHLTKDHFKKTIVDREPGDEED